MFVGSDKVVFIGEDLGGDGVGGACEGVVKVQVVVSVTYTSIMAFLFLFRKR